MWLAGAALPLPACAKETFTYQECSGLTASAPDKALDYATRWIKRNKNEAFAYHCQALARYGLQRFEESAAQLEEVARHPNLSGALQSQIWEQAEQAWRKAGDIPRAEIALSMAIDTADRQGLKDAAVKLLLRKANALVQQNKPLLALQELDHALTLNPASEEARTLKVSVLGQLGKPELSLKEGEALPSALKN